MADNRKQLARAIDEALQAMMDDGTYQDILDQWGISSRAISAPEVLTSKDIPEPTPAGHRAVPRRDPATDASSPSL